MHHRSTGVTSFSRGSIRPGLRRAALVLLVAVLVRRCPGRSGRRRAQPGRQRLCGAAGRYARRDCSPLRRVRERPRTRERHHEPRPHLHRPEPRDSGQERVEQRSRLRRSRPAGAGDRARTSCSRATRWRRSPPATARPSNLMPLNGIANPNRIWVGQRLIVSGRRPGRRHDAPKPAVDRPRRGPLDRRRYQLAAPDGVPGEQSRLLRTAFPAACLVRRPSSAASRSTPSCARPGCAARATTFPGVPLYDVLLKGYALHGTYWHNNFGHPMSHGCVNLRTQDAAWLFNWASVGTTVVTHWCAGLKQFP